MKFPDFAAFVFVFLILFHVSGVSLVGLGKESFASCLSASILPLALPLNSGSPPSTRHPFLAQMNY